MTAAAAVLPLEPPLLFIMRQFMMGKKVKQQNMVQIRQVTFPNHFAAGFFVIINTDTAEDALQNYEALGGTPTTTPP